MFSDHAITRTTLLAVLVLSGLISCRRQQPSEPVSGVPKITQEAESIVFPDPLRATDESVNAVIEATARACLRGDYDGFRVLWSAAEEPIARADFASGWSAISRIEVRSVEKLRRADTDETVYLAYLKVTRDPDQIEPGALTDRAMVVRLIREGDAWRLSFAPRGLREWIVRRADENSKEAAGVDRATTEPAESDSTDG